MSSTIWRNLVQKAIHQIYISKSLDPYINLSREHFLLQHSHPDSNVLFLYRDRPCAVVGRNQNPWLELNLASSHFTEFVRRRSGGGTVVHDEGNINYSGICPPSEFKRDKYAKMITRAMRRFNPRARVNERHDIVLDQGPELPLQEAEKIDPNDMHITCFRNDDPNLPTLKVSGSAYKLTRQRSLHHGTLLVDSDYPKSKSNILCSPARPYIKARGVESVRSPVGNIFTMKPLSREEVQSHVQSQIIEEFSKLHNIPNAASAMFQKSNPTARDPTISYLHSSKTESWVAGYLGSDIDSLDEIKAGIEELKSSQWLYGQTPKFTLSSHANEDDPRERPSLPDYFPRNARIQLTAKNSQITDTKISVEFERGIAEDERRQFDEMLKGKSIQEIADFREMLRDVDLDEKAGIARWLNEMLGKRHRGVTHACREACRAEY